MRTMNVEAVHPGPAIGGSGLARFRYLTRGAGYAVALLSLLSVGWLIQALLNLSMLRLMDASSTHLLSVVSLVAMASLPAVALMVVAVNLAPSVGVLRFAWLLLIGLLASLWSQSVVGRGMPDQMWYACFIEATLWTSSAMAVLLYHRDLSGAGGRLLRATIDQTAMDAESKRAQLRLLRAQLEPHFLFNTLATVKSLAQSDRNLTIEILENLRCYFMAALPRMKEDVVTLGDEILLIDSYLAIFQVRMGARLTYEIDIPDSLKLLRIPPLILLTLVENALKHGLTPLIEGGFISITAHQDHSSIVLRVIDTGRGMDLRSGYGFGLANVRQRLLMLYGAPAVLTLLAGKPRGVVATIRIPVGATEVSHS
jgi:signal transduction histidine kinase